MTRDQLLVFVHLYQDELDTFRVEQAKLLIHRVRTFVSPEFRCSEAGKECFACIKRVEEQLEEGLITGEEACNCVIDAVAQTQPIAGIPQDSYLNR